MAVSGSYIGEFEHMVLLAIMQLGDSAYGVAIMDELQDRIGRATSRGATYMTLDRMETKGLIKSRMGEPTAERGGRAKRLFTVTPAGAEAVRRSQAAYRELSKGLEGILGAGP
jgi:DNA-binding PadR family transcriptional regulator